MTVTVPSNLGSSQYPSRPTQPGTPVPDKIVSDTNVPDTTVSGTIVPDTHNNLRLHDKTYQKSTIFARLR